MDCKKHRHFTALLSVVKSDVNEFSLPAHPLNPPTFGGTVLLKLVSVTFHREGRVLNVYTLWPCPVSCYVMAVNALVCLHVKYAEEGATAKLSLDIISTKKKTSRAPSQ